MTPQRHSRLQEIFEVAINLAEPQRSSYLDQACAGDPDLRDRLIQLLNADDETASMAGPIPAAPARAGPAVMECPKCRRCYERPQLACPRDGAILQLAFPGPQLIDGKYLVEQQLGRGGMGAVYLAQHIGLEKRFALKLILQEGALSPVYRESFENEARALGRLSHRNIVNVTDYGVDSRGGGVPYLVMEYLVGKTLGDVLKDRKALPFEEAIGLLRATAEAVDAAHRQNIVHGDLKPSNLFLAEEPNSKQPCLKVVDFGLARLANPPPTAEQDDSSQKGEPGNIRGTPAYMAPELLRGEQASPASDRFAFGALMYELLTGRVPFGRQLGDLFGASNTKPPVPPSLRNPALPLDIDAPVLALLSPDAADRPASASAAVSAVAQAWLRAKQRKWRASEWPKRVMLAAGVTTLAALIAAGLSQLRVARVLEGRIADQRFALAPSTAPDPSLALVSIDDATVDADQRPLSDRADEFAAMLDGIFASGARAVAVDLLLPSRWSESQEFAKAVASHADRLVLALFSPPSGDVIGTESVNRVTAYLIGPQKYAALFGLVNLEEDEDRTVRRARLFYVDKAGRRRQSFAGRAVQAAFPGPPSTVSTSAPIWIDYSVRLRQLTPISWKDLPERLSANPELFRNRLVIAGATFAASSDEHRVPRVTSDKLVPGQFVQALIANTILAGNPIHEIHLSRCLAAAGLACLTFTAAALCFPQHYVWSLIASVTLLCGCAGLAFWIFRSSRTMIAVVGPELAILFSILAAWSLKSVLSDYPVTEP
jgi:serine/threonine protein kinase/CHASE2 domain-containing sensor protein